jgi:hypothetical protein
MVGDLDLDAMPFVATSLNGAPMARHARLVAIHVHRVEVGIDKFALVKRHLHPRQIGMQVLIHSGERVYAP